MIIVCSCGKWKGLIPPFADMSLTKGTCLECVQERQAEIDIPRFLRDREARILRLYKERHSPDRENPLGSTFKGLDFDQTLTRIGL